MKSLLVVRDPEVDRLLREALAEDDESQRIERPLDVAEVRRLFTQVLDALGSSIGMNASVNELLRQAAMFVEFEGWAGPGVLQRRLRVNSHIAHALIETLRDQGNLQETPPHWQEEPARQSEIRAESHVGSDWLARHRQWHRPGTCRACGREYERQERNQRYCPECREKRALSAGALSAQRGS